MRGGGEVVVDPRPQRPCERAHRLVLLIERVVADAKAEIATRLMEAADGRLEARESATLAAGFEPDLAFGDLGAQLLGQTLMAHQQLRERAGIAGLCMDEYPRCDRALVGPDVRLGYQGSIAPEPSIRMSAQRPSDKAQQRGPVDAGLGFDARKRVSEGIRGDSSRACPEHLGSRSRECTRIDLRPIGEPQGELLRSLACGHC